jgi:hypothetical protein
MHAVDMSHAAGTMYIACMATNIIMATDRLHAVGMLHAAVATNYVACMAVGMLLAAVMLLEHVAIH